MTDKSTKGREKEIIKKIRDGAKLIPQHVIKIHFEVKSNKEEALKRAKHYRVLRS